MGDGAEAPPSGWTAASSPDAPLLGLLRDGDLVTLDRRLAASTLAEEPGGIVEIRVIGGPGAGSVHRLGLGVHTVGSDPACAVSVRDPSLPGEAAVVRLTPDAITVEPGADVAPDGSAGSGRRGRAGAEAGAEAGAAEPRAGAAAREEARTAPATRQEAPPRVRPAAYGARQRRPSWTASRWTESSTGPSTPC
nr:hypothetical protein GCM10020093_091380 [Planobispora longispora]